jgi:hypothetical protein
MANNEVFVSDIFYIGHYDDVVTGLPQYCDLAVKYMSPNGNPMKFDVPCGYCTWYYYLDEISDKIIENSVDDIAKNKDKLPLKYMQIDDGWQTGNTYDPSIRDEKGMRRFRGDFWEYGKEKFPEGMIEITRAAKEAGLKLGIWFAPDSENNYALIDRDISVLKKAYDEWGVRFFKLDMYWIESDENKRQFMKLLNAVYSFGDDVAVQLDVTRDKRINYLCGKEYGSIFVENRSTLGQNAYPTAFCEAYGDFLNIFPQQDFSLSL